jgi:hypothetical protein
MRNHRLTKQQLALALVSAAIGCSSGSSPAAKGEASGGAGAGASSGGVTSGGSGLAVAGMSGAGASGPGGSSGGGSGAGSGGGTTSGAGGTGGAGGGAGGAPGGGSGGNVNINGSGGGVFVACDDHADFNGRGRCASSGKVGAVFARENLTAGASLSTLTAVFGTTKPPAEAGCSQEPVGAACVAVTCPRGAGASNAGPAAGSIVAKSLGGMLTTTPDAAGTYHLAQLTQPLWAPQAALAFSAAGGATPAFGESFCGPAAATITKPAGAPGAALVIDRSSDLQAQWTGGSIGELELVFRDDASQADSTLEVQCFFDAAAGQGGVAKAALAKIGPGVHAIASYVWVRKIGGGGSGTCVELTAIMTNDSSAGPGAPFNGSATFQ